MTLQAFEQILKAACPQTYELGAEPRASRCVVWHRFGVQSGHGDNRNLFDLPKLQVDILCKSPTDELVDDVCGALSSHSLPYSVQDYMVYDPDYEQLRTILQLVVV